MNHLTIIVGRQYSGKTTLAQFVANRFSSTIVEIGDIVVDLAKSEGQAPHVFAAAVLSSPDRLRFAKEALRRAALSNKSALIVGPRSPFELDYLCTHAPDALTLGLSYSSEVRFQRWEVAAPRKAHVSSQEMWAERESYEERWSIENTIAQCQVIIGGLTYGGER